MGQRLPKSLLFNQFIGEELTNGTKIFRSPLIGSGPLMKEMEPGLDTLYKIFMNSVKKYPNANILGTREVRKDGTFGEYRYKTYGEINLIVEQYANGLKELNLTPEIETRTGQKFKFMGIFSRNKEEWLITDIASHMNSVSVVPFYDTLGDSTIEFILQETNLITISMESTNLKKINDLAQNNQHHNLKNVILFDTEKTEEINKSKNLGLNVFTYSEILEKGRGKKHDFTYCTRETVAFLSYTSGTTGNPKGAVLTHGALASEITLMLVNGMHLSPGDMYLSYLPLAHVFERVINSICIYEGATIAFYSGSPKRLMEDAEKCHPTVFIAVPRVIDKIYKGVIEKVSKMPLIKQLVVKKATQDKLDYLHKTGLVKHTFWDKIVFGKIQKLMGSKLRYFVIGGSAITKELAELMKIYFSCDLLLGYGQTEMCGVVSVGSMADKRSSEHIGGVLPCVECRLVDIEEKGYTSRDKNPETGVWEPRGELLVRGEPRFVSYLNDPDKTKEVVDADGWLHTGDVATILTSHGNALKIIDRVKSLFKLSQGEYIAPEKLENIYSQSPFVTQIFVTGETTQNFPVAVVVPNKEKIKDFCLFNHFEYQEENLRAVYDDKRVVKKVVEELGDVGRENGLKGFEMVKRVYLSTEEFTVENNLISPTLKLKRNQLTDKFNQQISEMYKEE